MKTIQRAALSVIGCLVTIGSSFGQEHADIRMPVITIRAKRYEFQPSEITLKEGQKVKLIFISDDVPHGISVTELGISAEISRNHPTQMIIRPTTLGKFEGVCSRYCGAGHDTMRLVVNVT